MGQGEAERERAFRGKAVRTELGRKNVPVVMAAGFDSDGFVSPSFLFLLLPSPQTLPMNKKGSELCLPSVSIQR